VNRIRTLLLSALALLIAPAATGCGIISPGDGASGSPTRGIVKVGFITKFPADFYDTMVDAVKKYDSEHNDVTVVFGQGQSGTDDAGQIAIVENMIKQGVKAIAITPASTNLVGVLEQADRAGVKVVLVDNDIREWTRKKSVVATDNFAGGKLAGEWLAGKLRPGAAVAILQGRLGNASLNARVEGFKEGLGDGARIVAEPATDCDQSKGLSATRDILTRHPTIGAIFGACGPPITGALQAVKAAKKQPGAITVVGFDASPDELTAIANGEQAASVAQFPAKMGLQGIEAAVGAARGETVQDVIDTGTAIVTKDNLGQFR